MQIVQAAILLVSVVTSDVSAGTNNVPAFQNIAFTHASLRLGDTMSVLSRSIDKAETAPWERDFPREMDDVIAGNGTVLGWHSVEKCTPTPGHYVSSDCGSETTAAVAVGGAIESARELRVGNPPPDNIVGAVFIGQRDAPGRSGCFGFVSKGTIKAVNTTGVGTVTADVDLDFKVFNLFRFPKQCDPFPLKGRFVFKILDGRGSGMPTNVHSMRDALSRLEN